MKLSVLFCMILTFQIHVIKTKNIRQRRNTNILETTAQPETNNSTTATPGITTLRPLSERECFPGFLCHHGYCDKSKGFRCICDFGWQGHFCDTMGKCTLNCDEGKECIIVQDSYFCAASNASEPSTVTTSTPSTMTVTKVPEQPKNNTDGHVCSSTYTIKTLKERMCLPNLICLYGFCVKKVMDNSLYFTCECDNGAVGNLCEGKCCLECENGACNLFRNGTEFCNCQYGYEGELCQKKRVYQNATTAEPPGKSQSGNDWLYLVVGICLGLLFIIFVLAVVLLYYMWKQKVIFIMKIVRYFQPYEDDDEQIWDIFISYGAADENFVEKKLVQKLEIDLGFTLRRQVEDFGPINSVSKSLAQAVSKSRRTILILTPNYLTDELSKSEYHNAKLEMLQQKRRLIILLLGDISDERPNIYPQIKKIINSGMLLKYPDDGNEEKKKIFWERLELILPKKRFVSIHL